MSASSITNLPPAAFGSLLSAVQAAIPIADPTAGTGEPACRDSVDCRFLINDARSEIERLRRQLAGLETTRFSTFLQQSRPTGCIDQSPGAMLASPASPNAARRSYAVAPVGEVQNAPPAANDAPRLHSLRTATVVTNLGTLMNILV